MFSPSPAVHQNRWFSEQKNSRPFPCGLLFFYAGGGFWDFLKSALQEIRGLLTTLSESQFTVFLPICLNNSCIILFYFCIICIISILFFRRTFLIYRAVILIYRTVIRFFRKTPSYFCAILIFRLGQFIEIVDITTFPTLSQVSFLFQIPDPIIITILLDPPPITSLTAQFQPIFVLILVQIQPHFKAASLQIFHRLLQSIDIHRSIKVFFISRRTASNLYDSLIWYTHKVLLLFLLMNINTESKPHSIFPLAPPEGWHKTAIAALCL